MQMAVAVAIFDDDKILLTQREDFEVWCLPGGQIDTGESFPQAAVREAREETGLDVRLTHLVGIYTRLGWRDVTVAVFAAQVIGGALQPQVNEVINIDWFRQNELPADLLSGYAERIADAFEGVTGVCRTIRAVVPPNFPEKRADLYAARDASGLPRVEYYRYMVTQVRFEQETIEVPPLALTQQHHK